MDDALNVEWETGQKSVRAKRGLRLFVVKRRRIRCVLF